MKTTTNMKRYYNFFVILAIVSALAIVSNLFLRKGPVHDARAVDDIQTIQQNIDNYYIAHNQLPQSLAAVRLTGETANRLSDYDYVVTAANAYQLCATFMTVHHSRYGNSQVSQPGALLADPDEHIKGRQCFSYQVVSVGQPGYPYGVK